MQVDSDTYALAYAGTGVDGFISTFTISSDGSTITEVASVEHDENSGTHNSLVQVDSDTYALAYRDNSGEGGIIKTFTISSDGSTITEVVSVEHDEDLGEHNSLVQVDSDTYALAYAGAGGDGFIYTFTISSDGSTITEVASVEHDENSGLGNSLVHVNSDTYALAYAGDGSDGYISTFTIEIPVTETATATTSGGGNQSCNSRGFGVGKSLAVYEVSYNVCGNNKDVDILAYSTCGAIRAEITTEYGRSSAGLSLDQPFIDDEITIYTSILQDDIKSFTVKMENKRNEFEEKFIINECKGTKRYSQTTGYTSSQQGTFGDKGVTVSVPTWVKNTSGWWSDDRISENEFVKGIEYLIKERIIDTVQTSTTESTSSAVPLWVKNNAGWWAEGQIDDNSFVQGIEYLVKVGIIKVA